MPGYYFANCMLQLIARKQEIQKLKKQEGGLYEPVLIQSLHGEQPFFIGKEINLVDNNDPLAKMSKDDKKYHEIVSALKLQAEDSLTNGELFDEIIIQYGNKAIVDYQKRSAQIV